MTAAGSVRTRLALTFAATTALALTTGCGIGPQAAVGIESAPAYKMSGTVQFGNPTSIRGQAALPVGGATVTLYAAGITGYGSAATQLAQTTTATDGSSSFSFLQDPSYTTQPNTGNKYACPVYTFKSSDGTTATLTKDSLLYLVVTGGNTGAGTNAANAMMTVVGGCAAYQAGQFRLVINAVTTAASMAALSPYFSPIYTTTGTTGTSLAGRYLGTSTSYQAAYSTSTTNNGLGTTGVTTPMGYVGLANAFNTVRKLVDLSSGNAIGSTTITANGITMTATMELQKLNTIASILATCIDSTGGAPCTTLFGYTAPPANIARTSLVAGTFSTATDTLQAAYYMAVNPSDFATASTAAAPNAVYTITGATVAGTNIANLYNLTPAAADYQPTLTAQPSDWTLSVTYNSATTCGTDTTTGLFIGSTPYAATVDLAGNVAFINGATAATLSGITAAGAPNFCLLGAYSNGRTVMTDVGGNVWASTSSGTTTYLPQYNLASTTLTKWNSTPDGTTFYTPYAVASDTKGNVFWTYTGAGSLYQFPGAAFTTTTSNATLAATAGAAFNFYYLALDPTNNFQAPHATSTAFSVFPQQPTAGTYTRNSLTVSAAISTGYGIATDNSGASYGGNTCCSATVANEVFKIPLTYTTTSGTTTATAATPLKSLVKNYGGVNGVRSVAVDGAGNTWVGNYYTASGAASTTTALGTGIWAVSEMDANFNSVSPDPTAGFGCVSTNQYTCPDYAGYIKPGLGASRGLIVDQSGNVWVPSDQTLNNASTGGATAPGGIVEVIGVAVPTVQPLSIAARDGKMATKP